MNVYDELALWYLRLNGYFTTPTFIAHGNSVPQTDVDVIGARFPYSNEFPDDTGRLLIPPNKTDIVFAESRAGRCRLNGPWKSGGNHRPLEYVLRRVGICGANGSVSKAADELYAHHAYEEESYAVRIVCFGSKKNGTLADLAQILWPEVLSFINQRFKTYKVEKVEHQAWDAFGKYLWDRLSIDAVPDVADLVHGWKCKCPCWPETSPMTNRLGPDL